MPTRPRVVVAFHAHPDDESLLTGGTFASLARKGHRVVLVVATDGARGLTAAGAVDVAALRRRELDRAAKFLGVARVVRLGYPDSGDDGATDGFCHVPVDEVVGRLLEVVDEEQADVLIGYDERGGYGHPDHLQVHVVAATAASQRDVRLLQATVDRTWLERGVRLAARFRLVPHGADLGATAVSFSPRDEITHRVVVRRHSVGKRRALACHGSQTSGGSTVRTVRLLSRLPIPLFALVAGVEWFVEPGTVRPRRPLRDVFATATEDVA